MARTSTRRALSWRKKCVFAVLTTLGLLGLCEAALTAAGVRPLTDTRDPFVGFSNRVPLMEVGHDEAGIEFLHTATNKLEWFNPQYFPRNKPAGTKRVFCMGGSTTFGHPYDDNTSFCGWLRELLPLSDTSQQWEVINCGGISYASYRVAALMEELVQYEPDLFIVYSVHNEFLERRTYASMFEKSSLGLQLHAVLSQTRTYAVVDRVVAGARGSLNQRGSQARPSTAQDILPGEVDEILNHTVGPRDYHRDLAWREKVVQHYEFNLKRMVEIARQAGAAIVFITPASNEKNCAPFKSEWDANLSEADQARFWELMHRAEEEANAGEFDTSLATLDELATLAPDFAHVHFRRGHLLMELERNDEAYTAFRRALNEDVCPLRAVDEISQAIHRVGQEKSVPIVDFERRLHDLCEQELGHRCLGENYFSDHVHPTIEVNQKLALWILHTLREAGLIDGRDLMSGEAASDLRAATSRVYSRIDLTAHGVALRNLAKVLHWAGKFDEAAPRARDAMELLPNDPESRFVLADCLRHTGDNEGALQQYGLLFSGGKDWGRGYFPYSDLLVELGKYAQAKPFLMLGILRDPKDAYGRFLLGKVHFELGEYQFAIESLKESDRLFPNDPATLELIEGAKSRLSQQSQ